MFHKKSKVLPEDTKFPFDKLDASSKNLRNLAKEFAGLLSAAKPQSLEIKSLIKSLNNISTGKIHKMDEAFNDFKSALEKLSQKNKKKHAFSSGFSDKQVPPILEKYKDFIGEMVTLSEKANSLSTQE